MSYIGFSSFVNNVGGLPAMKAGGTADMPVTGYDGLVYVDFEAQTISIWEDGGWVLLSSGGGGAQNLEEVTLVGNNTQQGIEFIGNLAAPSENRMMRLYMNGAEGRVQCWDWRPGFEGPIPFAMEASDITFQGSDSVNLFSSNGSIVIAPATNNNIFLLVAEPGVMQSNGRITYTDDFSGDFDNRTLVDKEYVDSRITVNNGLTKTGTNPAQLGGALVKTTVIDYGAFAFQILASAFPVGAGYFQIASTGVAIGRTNAIGNLIQGFDIGTSSGSSNAVYGLTNYVADYSASFVARSLVDKAYVDSLVVGAGSGLSKVSNNIILGGALTSASNVNTNGQNFLLGRNVTNNAGQLQVNGGTNTISIGRINSSNTYLQSIQLGGSGTAMLITDTLGTGGLQNAGDYRAGLTANSLTPKNYVDGGTVVGTYNLVGDNVTSDFIVTHTAGFIPRAVILTSNGAPTTFVIVGGLDSTIMNYLGTSSYTSTQFTINISPSIVAAWATNSQNLNYTLLR